MTMTKAIPVLIIRLAQFVRLSDFSFHKLGHISFNVNSVVRLLFQDGLLTGYKVHRYV